MLSISPIQFVSDPACRPADRVGSLISPSRVHLPWTRAVLAPWPQADSAHGKAGPLRIVRYFEEESFTVVIISRDSEITSNNKNISCQKHSLLHGQ